MTSRKLAQISLMFMVGACRNPPPPPLLNETTLVAYLNEIRQQVRQASRRTLEQTKFAIDLLPDSAQWAASVIPVFRATRDASAGAMRSESSRLIDMMASEPALVITTRRHFAGDSELTAAATHLRWIVPVMFESYVVAVGQQQFDLVFIPMRSGSNPGWRALGSVDAEISTLLTAGTQNDPAAADVRAQCASKWRSSNGEGVCIGLAALAATAAMGGDSQAIDHACSLIMVHCN
jgi:hypothetical protein